MKKTHWTLLLQSKGVREGGESGRELEREREVGRERD